MPDAVEAGRRDVLVFDPLHQGERPELEQGGPSGQSLSDLLEQEDLRRAQEDEAVTFPLIGEELDRIEEGGLLLDLVQDHEAAAMIQPPDRIGSEAQPLVWIVKGEINGRDRTRRRQQITNQRGLPCLTRPCDHRDGPARQAFSEKREQPSGVKRHKNYLSLALQKCKVNLQNH